MIVCLMQEIATAAFSRLAMTFLGIGILSDKFQFTIP